MHRAIWHRHKRCGYTRLFLHFIALFQILSDTYPLLIQFIRFISSLSLRTHMQWLESKQSFIPIKSLNPAWTLSIFLVLFSNIFSSVNITWFSLILTVKSGTLLNCQWEMLMLVKPYSYQCSRSFAAFWASSLIFPYSPTFPNKRCKHRLIMTSISKHIFSICDIATFAWFIRRAAPSMWLVISSALVSSNKLSSSNWLIEFAQWRMVLNPAWKTSFIFITLIWIILISSKISWSEGISG